MSVKPGVAALIMGLTGLTLGAAVTAHPRAALAEARSLSDGEIQAAIQEILVQRHPKDDRAWWRALGPGAPRVIIRMAEAATEEYERHRLVGALGNFGDDAQAVDYLKGVAESTEDPLLRGTALGAVGAARGADAVEFLGRYLSHADPSTRVAAGRALRTLSDPRAQALVAKFLAEQGESWIARGVREEPARPARRLAVVATSEDGRVTRALAGVWKGTWVDPVGRGLRLRDAQVELRSEGSGEVRGELRQLGSDKDLTVADFAPVRVRGARFGGSLRISRGKAAPVAVPFEAELREQSGQPILEIRLPKSGATLLLRKS
jgi:hypothetical protein